MKRIIMLFAVVLAIGCTKDRDQIFDKLPEQRMGDRNSELRSKLLESESGWKASLATTAKGAYGFYIKFNVDESLQMVADLTSTSAATIGNSTFRIKYVMNTALIFDSYNYISMLMDPAPSVYGGAAGSGLKSDIEFEYIRSSTDSIVLQGKKYRNFLYLTKATAGEKNRYLNGEYLESINKTNLLFANSDYLFFTYTKGFYSSKVQVTIDRTEKKFSLTGVVEDGNVKSFTGKYSYTLDGIKIEEGIIYEGIKIVSLIWKGNEFMAVDDAGKEYLIQNSVAPIIPLYKLLGVKYKGLQVKLKTVYPGTSEAGAVIIKHYVNNLDNRYTGYIFNDGTLTLLWDLVNKRLTVAGWHNQNGNGGWTTSIVYDYTVTDDGEYKFTLRTPASGGYVSTLLSQAGQSTIDSFLRNNNVRFDYFVDGANLYGKMYSVNNPNIEMTFVLTL